MLEEQNPSPQPRNGGAEQSKQAQASSPSLVAARFPLGVLSVDDFKVSASLCPSQQGRSNNRGSSSADGGVIAEGEGERRAQGREQWTEGEGREQKGRCEGRQDQEVSRTLNLYFSNRPSPLTDPHTQIVFFDLVALQL